MAKKIPGFDLSIETPIESSEYVESITSGNISIGPEGLMVDGKKTSAIGNIDELIDLNQVLGHGASGCVRKVRHNKTNIVYALKTIQLAVEKSVLENLHEILGKSLVELRTLHHSSHPCIVSFYGAFYNCATLSLVLEYMDRGTMADILETCKVISENILSKIAHKIVRGLEYLHKELHLIHRDIKPQNILINKNGEVKITDFGVSGEIAHTTSFAKTFTGTIKYMSPERIKGCAHSAKSDIWSLGMLLLECVVGHFPYGNKHSFFSLMDTIVSSDIPKLPDTCSDEFRELISSCLQKQETDRPDSTALVSHAWFKKFNDDSTDVSEWLEKYTTKDK